MISDYLRKNAFNDSMIIQDQAYYSYFSGVDDVTHHGWCLNMDHFYLDDVIFVINETRPAYIVATYEGRYPEGAIAYFNETYTLIDFGYDGYPYLFETGYNKSIYKPRLMHEFFSRKIPY